MNETIRFWIGEELTLEEKYGILKSDYIRLLNDKQVLLEWGKPQLMAIFTVELGEVMISRLQLQLSIQSLKRKIELIRSALVRGVDYDIDEIELLVAAELAETELLINEEAEKLENSRHLLNNLSSAEHSVELRKLYKKLAKKLHPDVNPDLTAEQKEIWYQVQRAYESGDLEALQAIEIIYEQELNRLNSADDSITEVELEVRISKLIEGIRKLVDEINLIRSEFPFTHEKNIKDKEWLNSERESIEREIDQLVLYETELKEDYLLLINGTK